MTENKLLVSMSPHIRAGEDVSRIMWNVLMALAPALVAAYLFFGWRALTVVAAAGVTAVLAEWIVQVVRGVRVTVHDGSALLTGILLAFCLPPNVPLFIPVIGSVFAIGIAKHALGGLGANIWNPALAARAFLLASFPLRITMAKWPLLRNLAGGDVLVAGPDVRFDALTEATPLEAIKKGLEYKYELWHLIVGHVPGCLGETCALALLAGGVYLMAKKYVDWRVPLSYLGTVAVLVLLLPAKEGALTAPLFSGPVLSNLGRVLAHLFSGGLFLGAFFMATDMVTSPMTRRGQVIFGAGCGLLTSLIRLYGGYPEGVCYAILIMNSFVPLIDRFTTPRPLGG